MKSSMVRVPIRLGEDSFTVEISAQWKTHDQMKAFKHIMRINKVKAYMACATSALRKRTGEEVVANIKAKTGIDIQVIDGNGKQKSLPPPIFESINKTEPFSTST